MPCARAERREGDIVHSSETGQTPQKNLARTPGMPVYSKNIHRTPKDPAQIQLHLRYLCSPGQTMNTCFVWSSNFTVWRQNNFKCKSSIALKSGQKASALVGTPPSRTPVAVLSPTGWGELSQAACSWSMRPPRASRKAGQEPNERLSCLEYNS